MNRITADRALFQHSNGVFRFRFRWAKRTRPAVSLVRIRASVNPKFGNSVVRRGGRFWERKTWNGRNCLELAR
jgi:hypothetical protein